MVETVFGVLVLCILAFGITELGWYFKDASTLNTFARDYARDLSTGMTTTNAQSYITASNQVSSGKYILTNHDTLAFQAFYSTDGSTFPTNQTVSNDASGAKNSVASGDLILVKATYSHSRLTGLFGTGAAPMQASAVMARQ